jgi:ATP-dependent DNA helicase RecG
VTVQTLTQAASYRNPVLAEALAGLGYINRFGYGIQLAQRLLERNRNPPPQFTADPSWFRVVIAAR